MLAHVWAEAKHARNRDDGTPSRRKATRRSTAWAGEHVQLLLEFSIPAVVGVLVQMLYNVIDAVYVRGGNDGLAATTANPMMTAMIAVAMLVGVGGNALAAIKLGERRKDVAERVVGNSFVLLLVATVVLWVVSFFARAHPALLGRRRFRPAARARLRR